ncbi:hypothetical protein QQS21_001295 [Conoideocrella luteorostrata]|uniref:Xylanolytic transcriptional activator regulatory domain-containing protein n=1 Tax=Conoideocrella luteorostrata TaxID=1105319 RepID=A0AAJ0CY60_9HYPO|nr:hypothetical protein QQS21_001295 [Conoideocrella luteorostrata]
MSRCEELLKEYAPVGRTGTEPSHPRTKSGAPFEPRPSDTESSASYIMTRDDGNVRFTDNFGTVMMREELMAIQNSIKYTGPGLEQTPTEIDTTRYTALTAQDVEYSDPTSSPNDQPGSVETIKLWQYFLERVNPLSKIIHVPTLEPYVMRAAVGMHMIPFEYQALIYSICSMAVVAMSEQESVNLFGFSRDSMLRQFNINTKRALMKYRHLDNYSMVTLQALLFYLHSFEDKVDKDVSWVTSGIVVRMAFSMGYHRDGERMGFSPFETEMRRRIWSQVIVQDVKNALLSGLNAATLPLEWDTKQPLNINDADMDPNSDAPIVTREGPSEMAFVLVVHIIYAYKIDCDNHTDVRDHEGILLGIPMADNATTQHAVRERYRKQGEDLKKALGNFAERYIDTSAGRIHVAASKLQAAVSEKLSDAIMPMKEQPEWGVEIFNWKDNLFKLLTMSMEYQYELHDEMTKLGFQWYMKMQFYSDMMSAVTSHLYNRPLGSLADRGWRTVEKIYHQYPNLLDLTQKQHVLQAQFTLKAWESRKAALVQRGGTFEDPAYILSLRQKISELEAQKSNIDVQIDWDALWAEDATRSSVL